MEIAGRLRLFLLLCQLYALSIICFVKSCTIAEIKSVHE